MSILPSDSAASEDVWDGSLVEVEKRLFDYYISTDESPEDIYSDLLLWNFEEKREKLIASGMML